MRKKWTRRRFLGCTLAVGAGAALAGRAAVAQPKPQAARELTAAQLATLRGAIDEIVPAVDDMPAASAVGGVEYIARVAREDAAIRKSIAGSLTALESLSKKLKAKPFTSLSRAQRVEALQAFEKNSAADFAMLRDFTYEAYYTDSRVWKLIGYELHPTNEAGPKIKPFDEAVLAQVKKMPKRYREVS